MPMPPEQAALALREAILALPTDARDYLLNFTTKNTHREPEEFSARLSADMKERAEAAAIQKHRDEKVLSDALEAAKRLGVEVAVTGLALVADSETVEAKG